VILAIRLDERTLADTAGYKLEKTAHGCWEKSRWYVTPCSLCLFSEEHRKAEAVLTSSASGWHLFLFFGKRFISVPPDTRCSKGVFTGCKVPRSSGGPAGSGPASGRCRRSPRALLLQRPYEKA